MKAQGPTSNAPLQPATTQPTPRTSRTPGAYGAGKTRATSSFAARLARRKARAGSGGAATVEPDHAHGDFETLMKRVKPRPQAKGSRARIKAQRRQRKGVRGAGGAGEDDDGDDDALEMMLSSEAEASLGGLVVGLPSHGDDTEGGDQRGGDPTDWSVAEEQTTSKRTRAAPVAVRLSSLPAELQIPRVPVDIAPLIWAQKAQLALIAENRRGVPHISRKALNIRHAYLAQRGRAGDGGHADNSTASPPMTLAAVREALVAENVQLTAKGLPPVSAAQLSVPQQHAHLLAAVEYLALSRPRLSSEQGPALARSKSFNSHRRNHALQGRPGRPVRASNDDA